MVRTGNVDFSCKRLTSIEIRKSKYHIIRRVRFRWDTPPPPPPHEKDIWISASLMHHFETVPNSKKLQRTTEKWLLKDLTLSQTTCYRLFQTERVCRRQF